MIEKHISQLLKTTDRVIIPNFGAFLKSKGEVKSIIFNEFIKFNDGQLIQYVSDQEKISIEEASEKLDQFVEKLKASLGNGSKFHIPDVGLLYQDEKGRLRFDSGAVANDVAIEDEKKEKPEKEKAEADKSETKVESKVGVKEKPKKENEKKEEAEKAPPKEEKKKAPGSPKFPTPVKDFKKEESNKEKKVEEKKTAAVTAEKKHEKVKIKQPDPRKRKQPEEDEESKPRYLVAWIIILLFLVAIIVWLVIDWNNIPGYFKQESKMTNQEQIDQPGLNEQSEASMPEKIEDHTEAEPIETKTKEAAEENQKTKKQITEKEPEIKTPVSGPAKKYHLIAGVFGEEKNADKLANKLRNEGFYPEKLGKVNGLYYVTYNSFEKKQDAKYELKRLDDKGFEVWLYFY